MDADVIVVGAGPVGLMLAGELGRAGVRVLVLDRLAEPSQIQKAGGLTGQFLDLLPFRGLVERFDEASVAPRPIPLFPFGGMHVDFTRLAHSPMQALPLPQPRLEGLLTEIAGEFGVEIRRRHNVIGLSQDDDAVIAEIEGPDGPLRLRSRYLVGCDGASSRVRDLAEIPFPGITYPEVQRLAQVTVPDGVTLLDNGDIEVDGVGRIPFGFQRTERGEFALGSTEPGRLGVFTSEEETADYDDDQPMTIAEVGNSVRRVLGVDLPLGEPIRMVRFTFHARHVERYVDGRIMVAGDAAHLFPSPGVPLSAGMLDTVNLGWKLAAAVHGWAPDGLLDTYHEERHLAGERTMLHTHAQVALRRGHDAAGESLRELFQELLFDEQAQYRLSAMMAGADIRYPMPGGDPHPLAGGLAPDLDVVTAEGAPTVSALMRAPRPLLLDLADRADVRGVARGWNDRIDIVTATAEDRPADAILIRPDAYVAWAADVDEPADTATAALHESLRHWFGAAREP